MIKRALTVAAMAAASLTNVPTASAHEGTYWQHHRHVHVAYATPARHHRHHVYYSGTYANVSRDDGSTTVYAYPGVSVFVGAGGGVSVSVGF